MNSPCLHSTPDEAIADRIRETVFIEKKTFLIERPAGLDKVFDHPAVRAAYAKGRRYWHVFSCKPLVSGPRRESNPLPTGLPPERPAGLFPIIESVGFLSQNHLSQAGHAVGSRERRPLAG